MAHDELSLEEFCDYLKSVDLDMTSHDAEVLLLTCIDFRFFAKIAKHMDDAGLKGKYDQVILAGAELGPVIDFPPNPRLHWQQFFLEHLALAKDLHRIKRVVVLGHRDCGAYKKFGLLPERPTPDQEYAAHKLQAERLKQLVLRFHSDLKVDKFLLSLGPGPAEPLTLERLD